MELYAVNINVVDRYRPHETTISKLSYGCSFHFTVKRVFYSSRENNKQKIKERYTVCDTHVRTRYRVYDKDS